MVVGRKYWKRVSLTMLAPSTAVSVTLMVWLGDINLNVALVKEGLGFSTRPWAQLGAQLVAKYAKKYEELKAAANDAKKSDEDRYAARLELQKLPRNAYPTRQRNRCELTGRPRGTFRKFGLGRNKIRELAFKGDIPGVIKASW